MAVCGAGFFALHALLRALHLNHLLSSFAVLIAAFPLMYILVPISTLIYFAISRPETRRTNIHVTDAGMGALVYLVLGLLFFGVMGSFKQHQQHEQNAATRASR